MRERLEREREIREAPTVEEAVRRFEALQQGVKHDEDKTRPELLSPFFLLGVSDVLAYGARKYEDRNWEKGILYSRVYGALLRHLFAWWGGATNDRETGMHHLYHASCCLMFLAHYEADTLTYAEWDDRP